MYGGSSQAEASVDAPTFQHSNVLPAALLLGPKHWALQGKLCATPCRAQPVYQLQERQQRPLTACGSPRGLSHLFAAVHTGWSIGVLPQLCPRALEPGHRVPT